MRIFSALLLIFFMFSCSALQAQEGTYNQKDANGKKTGNWRGYYPDGKLRYEGQFKSDAPFDVFKFYFQTGEVKTVMTYRSPKETYARHYYSTGEWMAEGKYINQLKDSIWTSYGAGNKKVEEGAYLNGKRYGWWKTYHLNGRVADEIYFESDLEQDVYKTYYDDGTLKQEAIYVDGFLNGLTTYYNPSGKKVLKGIYKNGVRDKRWIFYTEDMKIRKVLLYENGKLTNPEDLEKLEDTEEFKQNKKDFLEFEDLRGKIRYE